MIKFDREQFENAKTYDLVNVQCNVCGSYVDREKVKIARALRGGTIFTCCKMCQNKSQQKRETRRCECCSKEFSIIPSSKKKYCSSSCAAKQTNIKRQSTRDNRNCIQCGAEFYPATKTTQCCSRECSRLIQAGIVKQRQIELFQKGQLHHAIAIKKVIKHLHGSKCEICGQIDTHNNKPLVLQLDHINGDSDNNLPENVRLLCPNCHSQTDTFCFKNKRNPDSKRSKRYRKQI